MTHARVRDVMTADVIAVPGTAPGREIAALLREHRVSALPVVDGEGRVIGVVSAGDLLAWHARHDPGSHRPGLPGRAQHGDQGSAADRTAAGLMTAPPVTVKPADLVSHAARLMYARRVKRLPVVAPDGRLAGIIARSDVLAVFSRPDEDIRREIIRDVILDGFFTDPARVTVTVRDGIVTLEAPPELAVVSHGVAAQVRHMEGVVAVRERSTGGTPDGPGPAGLA